MRDIETPVVLDEIANVIHHLHGGHAVVGNQSDGDLRVVPAVVRIELRRRNVPVRADSLQNGMDDVTLFFERMGVLEQQMQGQKTNEHEKKPFRSGATSGLRLSSIQTIARLVDYYFIAHRGVSVGVRYPVSSTVMKSEFPLSRRHFLEGCACALGVTLVGCSSDSGGAGTTQAVAQGNGFVIKDATQVESLENGQALPFEFPGDVAGLLFRTKSSELGAVNAVCTHAGCIVNWSAENPAKAFGCPCHGSVFTIDGKVVQGPATKPLAHYNVKLGEGDAVLTPA